MAKAKANCICATCGASFERTSVRANRSDAENWVKWAEKTFDECPSCYGKRIRKEEIEAGLICRLRLQSSVSRASMWYVGYGDTYSIRSELKASGWYFTDRYPTDQFLGGVLSLTCPSKRWAKEIPITGMQEDELANTLQTMGEEVERFGFKLESQIKAVDIALARQTIAEAQKKKQEADEKQKSLDALRGPKPQRPEWMATGRWNGVIYGKSAHSIYLDGEKRELSPEETEELEAYSRAIDVWNSYGK